MEHLQVIEARIFRRYEDFAPLLRQWKEEGQRIVFTNGCFDLLHRGHVEYLARAASKGSRMVIGLNSDQSVSKLKGGGRPFMDEYSRAFVLAGFQFVSAVVIFEEETPAGLIEAILPDYLIKGSDYSLGEIAGQETVISQGGKVETIALVPGYSTSALIKKIKNQQE